MPKFKKGCLLRFSPSDCPTSLTSKQMTLQNKDNHLFFLYIYAICSKIEMMYLVYIVQCKINPFSIINFLKCHVHEELIPYAQHIQQIKMLVIFYCLTFCCHVNSILCTPYTFLSTCILCNPLGL